MDRTLRKRTLFLEYTFYFGVLSVLFLIVYFTNRAIINASFLILLGIIWQSKRDYFWLAIFIFIYSHPGRLFYGSWASFQQRLPLYSLLPGISLGFDSLLMILYSLKIIVRNKAHVFNNKYSLWLLLFITFYWSYSFIYGVSSEDFISSLRHIMALLLYFPIVSLIKKDEFSHFFYLISSIVFISLLCQIFFMVNGKSIAMFITGNPLIDRENTTELAKITSFSSAVTVIRYIDSLNILFMTFVSSLYLLSNRTSYISLSYLKMTIIVSFLIIILSATRGWTIAFSTVFVLTIFLHRRIRFQIIPIAFIAFLVFSFLTLTVSSVSIQLNNAILRIMSISSITQGDITAGGTDARVSVGRQLVQKGLESPFFGYGISKQASDNFITDTGMQSLFVQIGFVGLFILSLILLKYIQSIQEKRKLHANYNYGIFIVGILGLLIMHTTTNILFNFFKTNITSYLPPIYFGITTVLMRDEFN